MEDLLESLEENLKQIRNQNHLSNQYHIVVVGDFNYPGINWAGPSPYTKPKAGNKQIIETLVNTLNEYGMKQLIEVATHIHGNTLDLVMTNAPNIIKELMVYPPSISDHSTIEFEITQSTPKTKEAPRTILDFKKAKIKTFSQALDDILDTIKVRSEQGGSVDALWEHFNSRLMTAIKENIPTRISKKFPNQWFTRKLHKAARNLKRYYARYKKSGDPELYASYQQKQKMFRKQVREQKRYHLAQKVVAPLEEGDSKPFFKYLKTLYKNENHLNSIKVNGIVIEDPTEIAQELNSFFASQFNTEHQIVEVAPITQFQQSNDTSPKRPTNFSIEVKGIIKLIEGLKCGKAPGPDGITPSILKLYPETFAECLAIIMNVSFKTGQVPKDWKQSNIIPIHKGGSKEPSNYRPISLTSIPCKMTEHMVVKELNRKLDIILSNKQHGFRTGLSCETQLVMTYHKICKQIDLGKTVHSLVLDFRKAFDMVPHGLIVKKLIMHGFDNCLIRWITNFLASRQQRVLVRGFESTRVAVTSGVPQGSVIGPKLFLLYINDLPDCIKSNASLFADDTFIYRVIHSDEDWQVLQSDIHSVENWSKKWLMPLNAAKTQLISFGKGRSDKATPQYKMGGVIVQEVKHVKYLGVTLSSNMEFSEHVSNKIKKATQVLGLLKRTLWNAPQRAKLLAYKAMCRPILEYASVVWDPHLKKHIYNIEMVQNRAIRFIASIKGRDTSITEVRNTLGLETLECRRKEARLRLIHKMMSNDHPVLMNFLDAETQPERAHQTRATMQHLLPSIHAHTNMYYFSFLPRTIRDMRLVEAAQAPRNADHN